MPSTGLPTLRVPSLGLPWCNTGFQLPPLYETPKLSLNPSPQVTLPTQGPWGRS